METDTSASPSKRPRPILLILLGVVLAAFLFMQLGGGSTGPSQSTSNPPRVQQRAQPATTGEHPMDPSKLDVHLEALAEHRPDPGESERNPFRFQPKAPPAPPPSSIAPEPPPPVEAPIGPPQPPPPPPITMKFIGTLETADGAMRAMLTDCTAGHQTKTVREGETVFGQYRLVKIGLESVVVEHIDGRGRTTLAKNGQECVWK
jgi:hypothetical protein